MSEDAARLYGFSSMGKGVPVASDGIKTIHIPHRNQGIPAEKAESPAAVPSPAAPQPRAQAPRAVLGCPVPGATKRERLYYLSTVETFLLNQLYVVRTLLEEENKVPDTPEK